ncbi:MAG TPA: hypothetical protein DCS07_04065 [Bdellovibrionales bacterium]|nr:MAG: hypothetical protein A2Z97_11865 [Bdellovibrionales bacterium GWB1_52_6]OFZ05343.1 MAG: hypothetical protein A2X97_16485 [Bdellovibrionales bacterium GWA1_52_35]OFZ43320.1 MAG: hypothetical protein A2070_02830 [Bdellovibrionales bacterium GWC1_52_8]HAR41793.1 hypothetical protein [Bdellovibrionales bacterium]HCM39016.1 hypothetical protein [Bdellovibrionales bacterium]
MKLKTLAVLSGLLGIVAVSQVALGAEDLSGDGTWTKVRVEPVEARINPVYDENEPVRIELAELFPNFCYRPAPVETRVEIETGRIVLTDFAFVRNGDFCTMAVRPHSRSVEVGVLPEGRYELWLADESGAEGKIGEFQVQ